MSQTLENSIVRIIGANLVAVGAGVLISEQHVASCAHVVSAALGLRDYPSGAPTETISLDFPFIARGSLQSAKVIAWQPPGPDGGGDIAIMELEKAPPEGCIPAPLAYQKDMWGHSFRAFGFPSGYEQGVWASGRILAGQVSDWLQVEEVKQTGYFIQPGFSGGPIWNEQLKGVVGISVMAEKQSQVRTAFILPIIALGKLWPNIKVTIQESVVNKTSDNYDTENSRKARKGLEALEQLMQNTDVREAVIAFRTDFQAASSGVRLIGQYKFLHDQFQELESHYYLIEQNRKRLPNDETIWESIELEQVEIQNVVGKLLLAVENSILNGDDTWWVKQLTLVRDEFQIAIEGYDGGKLQNVMRRIHRVLDRQVSRTNAQLVTTAGALRLDTIVEAMDTIKAGWGASTSPSETLVEFTQGLESLRQLDVRIFQLVSEHNSWQDIDDELRRIEANLEQDLSELEMAWPDVKAIWDSLSTMKEKWGNPIQEAAMKLEESLTEGGSPKSKRFFRLFRSQTSRRFRQVDYDLLKLCQELQRIGEPLALLLRAI